MSDPKIGPDGLPYYEFDPDDEDDFGFDWSVWLDGRTITGSAWVVPAGLALTAESFTTTTTSIRLTLSGTGVASRRYRVTNRISGTGFSRDRSFNLVVKEL